MAACLEFSDPALKSGSVRLSLDVGRSKTGESMASDSDVVCGNPNFPIPIEGEIDSFERKESIFKAARKGDTALFRSLSEDQLSWALSPRYARDESLLDHAASFGQIEVVGFLAEADTSRSLVNAVNNKGWSPLHTACFGGFPEVVELLIHHGANLHLKSRDGSTPLHIAAAHGRLEVVKVLILHGAELNAKNKVGLTPLHYAVMERHLSVCEVLISEGAEIDAADRIGQTPLSQAVTLDDKEIALFLMRHGADMTDKKVYAMLGRYPADYKDGEVKLRTRIPGSIRLSGASPIMNGGLFRAGYHSQNPDADPRLLDESENIEMANIALSSYNKRRGLSVKGCGYELVKTIGGVCLPKAQVHHLNFLARPSNGREVDETRLFFAEVKWKWGAWFSLCRVIGPVGTVTRFVGCKICIKYRDLIKHPLHKKAFTQ